MRTVRARIAAMVALLQPRLARLSGSRRRVRDAQASASYWTRHNVTYHHAFQSVEESLDYFAWRNSQYPGYIELMPVTGFDGERVLDFGCGPGHDLVGFGTFSCCARLVGVDVSPTSLAEARARIALHRHPTETILLAPAESLPFEDGAFDYVHSSGVLHHVEDPVATLRELYRVLRPGGTMRVMVYNRASLWLHLYVEYHRTLVEGRYPGVSLTERFARSTDGDECPIARCYLPSEWIAVAESAGFQASFVGAAVSLKELSLLNTRFEAIMDRRLPTESRQFLEELTFDDRHLPMHCGHRAGVDAVYHLERP